MIWLINLGLTLIIFGLIAGAISLASSILMFLTFLLLIAFIIGCLLILGSWIIGIPIKLSEKLTYRWFKKVK